MLHEIPEQEEPQPAQDVAVVIILTLLFVLSLSTLFSYVTHQKEAASQGETGISAEDNQRGSDSAQRDQTVNDEWRRYEDPELRYSFRYPPDWHVLTQQSIEGYAWTMLGPADDDIRLTIEGIDKPAHVSLDDVVAHMNVHYYSIQGIQSEKLTLDSGEPYYRLSGFTESFVPYTLYYIGNDRQIIVVRSLLNKIHLNARTTEGILGEDLPESPTRRQIISSIVVEE